MLLRSVTTEHGAGNCLSTDAGNQQFALYFMSKFRLNFVFSLGRTASHSNYINTAINIITIHS